MDELHNPTLIFRVEDRDPNDCGRCGRPGGAHREHACLNDDGSSVYFREKYGTSPGDGWPRPVGEKYPWGDSIPWPPGADLDD